MPKDEIPALLRNSEHSELYTSLRNYFKANMFDGCEDGTISMKVSILLDDVAELTEEYLTRRDANQM